MQWLQPREPTEQSSKFQHQDGGASVENISSPDLASIPGLLGVPKLLETVTRGPGKETGDRRYGQEAGQEAGGAQGTNPLLVWGRVTKENYKTTTTTTTTEKKIEENKFKV